MAICLILSVSVLSKALEIIGQRYYMARFLFSASLLSSDPKTDDLEWCWRAIIRRLPPFIGCAYQRGSRTRSPCCRIKSSTEVRPGIWDPSCLCQISPVDGRCVLRIPIGFSYRPPSSRQSTTEPSRLPVPASGTPCRKKSRRHRHRWSSADALRLGCSGNSSQTSLSDVRLLYSLFCFVLLTLR